MRIDKTRSRVALAALLALALAFGAVACGGGSSSSSGSESSGRRSDQRRRRRLGRRLDRRQPRKRKVKLTIGSKNFPEQEILGEIYAQALTAAGYKVRPRSTSAPKPWR